MNIGLDKRDEINDAYWETLTAFSFRKEISKKRLSTKRFRWCTRGEPFSTIYDVLKIRTIALTCPEIDFWAPTRGWRNANIRDNIETYCFPIPNLFITASIDPSNTQQEISTLVTNGWSTHFFGDDRQYPFILPSKVIKCPAKWGDNITCMDCNVACYNPKQTHSWLKEH